MRDQKLLSLSPVNSWLQRCLVRGRILDFVSMNQLRVISRDNVEKMTEAEQLAGEWEAPILKAHVYPAFSQYCKESSRKATGENSFWKELYKAFRPQGSKDSKIMEERTRTRPQLEGQTTENNHSAQKQLTFPSLELSKQLFCDNAVHEPNWSFDTQGEVAAQEENAVYDDAQLGLQQVFS